MKPLGIARLPKVIFATTRKSTLAGKYGGIMSTKIASVAAMLLMVLLPASRLFAYQTESQAQLPENQTGSTVRATGSATIDGKPVGQSSELSDFAILDSGDGSATITRKESTVLLGAGTRTFLSKTLNLQGRSFSASDTSLYFDDCPDDGRNGRQVVPVLRGNGFR